MSGDGNGANGHHKRHMLLAGCATALSYLVALTYCLATWSHPHRPPMLVFYGVGALTGCVIIGVGLRRVATGIRRFAMLALTVSSIAIPAVGAYLDGGIDTPAGLGFIPPAVLIAINTRPRVLFVLESVVLAAYLTVTTVGAPPRPGYAYLLLAGLVLIVCSLAMQARLLARQRAELRMVAQIDPLTGALNRRGLDELTESLRDAVGPLSVICLDLDGFKQINDSRGHSAGDELLQWVVAAIRTALRPGDSTVRLGGDEFAVVLAGAGPRVANARAAAIVAALSANVRASVGTASRPLDGHTLQELMVVADRRLYEAKHARSGPERDRGA